MNTFIIIVLYDFDKLLSMQLFVYSFRPVKNKRQLADNKSLPVKKKSRPMNSIFIGLFFSILYNSVTPINNSTKFFYIGIPQ